MFVKKRNKKMECVCVCVRERKIMCENVCVHVIVMCCVCVLKGERLNWKLCVCGLIRETGETGGCKLCMCMCMC